MKHTRNLHLNALFEFLFDVEHNNAKKKKKESGHINGGNWLDAFFGEHCAATVKGGPRSPLKGLELTIRDGHRDRARQTADPATGIGSLVSRPLRRPWEKIGIYVLDAMGC